MKAEISVIDNNGNKFVGTVELLSVKGEKRQPKSSMAEKVSGKVTTLSEHIIKLRNSGFFSRPRTAREVHGKLQGSYHCEIKRVGVALIRLQKARELRKTNKTENNKTNVAYVW